MNRFESGATHVVILNGPPEVLGWSLECRCGWVQDIATEEEAPAAATVHLRAMRDDQVWINEGLDVEYDD